MAKRVQVALTESIASLGKEGDLVDVAPGYARNFLLPYGKAMNVTPAVLKQIERKKEKEKIAADKLKQEALDFQTALSTIGRFTIKKQVGEDGVLFGTVTNGDVAEAIEAATKKEIDRRNITVPDIHNLGSFTAKIKLHPEVNAEVNIEVTPGYARNFLLPYGKAMNVTPAVLKQIERKKEKEKIAADKLKQEALDFKTALSTIGRFTIKKQVGEDGVLFGTVTNGDVAEAIEAATKKEIDRRNITVPDIHNLGSFTAKIKLHPEVNAEVNIEVTS